MAEAGMLSEKARAIKELGELASLHSVSDTDSDEAFENALEHLEFKSDMLVTDQRRQASTSIIRRETV